MTKAKKPTHYACNTSATELNRRFYQRYDENLLFNKALAIACILDDEVKFKLLVAGYNVIEPSRINDKFFESLRAELHFTEMHQFEGFFALLLAWFKDLPHWIYLTAYHTSQIGEAIHQFIKGDINTVTKGKAQTDREFVDMAVYATYKPQTGPRSDRWDENLDNIAWLVRHMAEKYIASREEYNSYKHGLRVMTGESSYGMHLTNLAGEPIGPYIPMAYSKDSLGYLEIEEGVVQTIQHPTTDQTATVFIPTKKNGSKEDQAEEQIGKVINEVDCKMVYEVLKHFNPKQSMCHLSVMNRLLATMKNTRLAYTDNGRHLGQLTNFLGLDKNEILALRENSFESRMSI